MGQNGRTTMNLTETYKSICESIGITLVFASLNQANSIMDQIKGVAFPALVVLPYEERDDRDVGTTATRREAPLEAWLVTKVEKARIDEDKTFIQTGAIEPMLLKARQFMKRLNQSAIVRVDNPAGGVSIVTYKPLYSEMDALVFGVTIECVVPLLPPTVCLA